MYFVNLFYADESAEENDIALFNAIHDEPLPEGTTIRKFRWRIPFYMNLQNDISFDVGGKILVFGEHQLLSIKTCLCAVFCISVVYMSS